MSTFWDVAGTEEQLGKADAPKEYRGTALVFLGISRRDL